MKAETTMGMGLGVNLALHNSLVVSPFLEVSFMSTHETGVQLHSSLSMDKYGRVGPA